MQKDAFLAAIGNIDISIAVQKKIGAGLFGGEGFILERISGNRIVFLHAGGDLVSFNLSQSEIIKIDTRCAVAWDESVNYNIQHIGNIKTKYFWRRRPIPKYFNRTMNCYYSNNAIIKIKKAIKRIWT